MTRIAPILLILLLALPGAAPAQEESGRDQMQRGAELFLRGLRGELGPALEDLQALAEQAGPAMRSFLTEMGPAMAGIFSKVSDWSRYEPPEMLPNGDIIIRRKPEQAPEQAPETKPGTPDKPIDL